MGKRTEICLEFTNDIRKDGSQVFNYYPLDIILQKPLHGSRLYKSILERTGDEQLACSVENWAVSASVGDKYMNDALTATVERW